jgi:hypothetical protein
MFSNNKNNSEPKKHLKAQMSDKKLKSEYSDKKQESLTASDINNILNQEELINFKPLPYVEIFGKKVNLDALIISSISIILWICLWKFFNLFEIGTYSLIFFFLYIAILIFNIFNSSIDTERNLELATYEIEKQVTNSETVMGVIIILYVFLYNIQMDSNLRLISYKLLTIIMFLLSFSVLKYALKNDTKNIRIVRIFTEKFYNQSIILFIFSLFVIYSGIIKK